VKPSIGGRRGLRRTVVIAQLEVPQTPTFIPKNQSRNESFLKIFYSFIINNLQRKNCTTSGH